jgi:hypothetical protein
MSFKFCHILSWIFRFDHTAKNYLQQFMFTFSFLLLPHLSSQDTFWFTENPRNLKPFVVENQPALLRCDVNNHHLIKFHWTLDDKVIADSPRRFVAATNQDGTWVRGSHLRFMSIDRLEDNGSFKCVATNVSTHYAIITEVDVKLSIHYISDGVEVQLKSPKLPAEIRKGVDVKLNCRVNGHPAPNIEWYESGKKSVVSQHDSVWLTVVLINWSEYLVPTYVQSAQKNRNT